MRDPAAPAAVCLEGDLESGQGLGELFKGLNELQEGVGELWEGLGDSWWIFGLLKTW